MVNDYAEYAETEERNFQAHLRVYELQNPPPERPALIQWKADFESVAIMFTAIMSLVLSAMRTGDQFYQIVQAQSINLARAEAITAVFAMEGALATYAMSLGRKHNTKNMKWIGLFLVSAVVIVASFGQSSRAFETTPDVIKTFLEWALTILLGPVASIAAIVASHMFGSRLSELRYEQEGKMDQYEDDLELWHKKALASWNSKRNKIQGNYVQKPQPARVAEKEPESPVAGWGHGELRDWVLKYFKSYNIPVSTEVSYDSIADWIEKMYQPADANSIKTIVNRLRS